MKSHSQQQVARLKKMLAAAQQARQSGQYIQAENLYRDILKEAPEAHDVRHQWAVLLATTGRSFEAAKQFRLILRSNPAHAATHANLANALTESGELEEAIKEYRRALALNPRLAWAHAQLGAALRLAGEFKEALVQYKQALDLDPKNANAFNGLGLVCRDLGDLPRALECLESAAGLAPYNADFRLNFGVTLNRAGMPDLAVVQFYKAAELRPDMLGAWVLLGETLGELHRYDDAKACFDRALQIKPGEPELLERRGFVYLEMGDAEHAIAEFRQVADRHPARTMCLLGLARSHQMTGHGDEAEAVLEAMIRHYPADARGYYSLAISRRFKPDDPLISQFQALADKTDDAGAAIDLGFALGKIYDDCKQWDTAFAHYARANHLQRQKFDFQPKRFDSYLNALMRVFSREFLQARQDFGVEANLPVFIVGMPRSGTTLTEQIIASHPRVIGAGELRFLDQAAQSMPFTLNTSLRFPDCLAKMTPDKAHQFAGRYIELLHKIAGSDADPARITDKMPHNFLILGMIAMLFPQATIIHCKRDAMDNCLSMFFQKFNEYHSYACDLDDLGHYYRQYERLMAHWHAVLPGRILDINYEDTIADPEFWSRKLIEHVGLEWNDACLAPHKLERTVKTISMWQVRQPIYKTSVQRWKNYEKHLDPLKEALGYMG